MREFIDVTGKTEEEAIQNALRQLGLDRDDVSVEILERAKSGFLGLGSCPAKVRVSYGPEEEEEAPAAPASEPQEERQEERPKPPKAEKKPRQERRPAETPAVPAEKAPAEPSAPVVDLGEEVDDEKAQAIRKFLSGLLEQMENTAEIHVYLLEKGRYKVILEGMLGIGAESLAKQENLTYTRHFSEALASARSGESQCVFFVNPARVKEIREVADAGETMPQKSTWFYPKLLTGLAFHPLDE